MKTYKTITEWHRDIMSVFSEGVGAEIKEALGLCRRKGCTREKYTDKNGWTWGICKEHIKNLTQPDIYD